MVSVVPDFSGAASTTDMAQLKTLCEEAKPLGLIRTESGEIMVIYDGKFPFHILFDCPSSYLNYSSWMLHHEAWRSLPEKRIHPLGDESYSFCTSRVARAAVLFRVH